MQSRDSNQMHELKFVTIAVPRLDVPDRCALAHWYAAQGMQRPDGRSTRSTRTLPPQPTPQNPAGGTAPTDDPAPPIDAPPEGGACQIRLPTDGSRGILLASSTNLALVELITGAQKPRARHDAAGLLVFRSGRCAGVEDGMAIFYLLSRRRGIVDVTSSSA